MLIILRQYEEDELLVTEYTTDFIEKKETGEIEFLENAKVSHVVKTPIPTEPLPEEPQPTLEEKFARMEQQLQEQALVQLEVLATIYEELLMKG